ncbi:methyl-accepting chemotaxis protein [Jeotgalibacillus sp. R-1-5s-1]|uniref:methyl-accepting chemotaxis protein n=1 Tax=Jeotgalibacillus sp. R-1-5s-1 TaxID=2555897 RepID=UPI00106B7C8F|nr:methyl-accepting chemotaxis protein [Jeotgalibacillus sp. R-1-5s-1]TFE01222.1 methyl-accepting chemotaxis protein [Jeotgalibacillus sp. R-1-5s-1]
MKKLKWKLLSLFLVLIVLIGGLAAFNIYSISSINQQTERVLSEDLALLEIDQEMRFNVSQQIALTRGYVLYGEAEYKNGFEELAQKNAEFAEVLQSHNVSNDVKSVLTITRVWEDGIRDRVFSMYDNGREEDARVLFRANFEPTARGIMDSLEKVSNERSGIMNTSADQIIETGNQTILLTIIISGLVIVTAIVLSLVSASKITKPIISVTKRMKAIAAGELPAASLQTKSKDEVGQLVHTVNEMNNQLRNLVSDITLVSGSVVTKGSQLSESAQEVREGSSQIAVTMNELAVGAGIQAEASSSLSTKMIAFTERIRSSAEKGNEAQERAEEMYSYTSSGGKKMAESIHKVNQINDSFKTAMERVNGLDDQTKNISKLVQVIQEIADQTNLLALNAAIESARAGEHGRGFAVVADEVRKLAVQVSASITDITSIITTIQRESKETVEVLGNGYELVSSGTAQMEETAESFGLIEQKVNDVSERMKDIASSLYEIVNGTEEINHDIEQIAAVSEEAAAGIEETTANAEQSSATMNNVYHASVELISEAQDLQNTLGHFKLETADHQLDISEEPGDEQTEIDEFNEVTEDKVS